MICGSLFHIASPVNGSKDLDFILDKSHVVEDAGRVVMASEPSDLALTRRSMDGTIDVSEPFTENISNCVRVVEL